VDLEVENEEDAVDDDMRIMTTMTTTPRRQASFAQKVMTAKCSSAVMLLDN
jgi:hypothetical protein